MFVGIKTSGEVPYIKLAADETLPLEQIRQSAGSVKLSVMMQKMELH